MRCPGIAASLPALRRERNPRLSRPTATQNMEAVDLISVCPSHLKSTGYFGVRKIHALFEATYVAGLRKAGVPDE